MGWHMRVVRLLVAGLFAAAAAPAMRAQPPEPHALMPLPDSVQFSPGAFTLAPDTRIVVTAEDPRLAGVRATIAASLGLAVPATGLPGGSDSGTIALALDPASPHGDEGYQLTVTPSGVTIVARTPAGVFYGAQTFRQLLPPYVEYRAARPDRAHPLSAAAVSITDAPRFAWRGAMLDVARHFMPVEAVERYIDLMALYKLNRLHLHLADDQGWRIEIASRPRLTAIGGRTQVGGGAGGFYTKADYAALVAYAGERFITIVPEIDMPGHTNAALASYPDLNCSPREPALYTGIEVGFSALCVEREAVYTFLDEVIGEIAAMTPGAYFHVGGDEVKTLTPEQYVRFIDRVQQIVVTHHKIMIGWDDVAAASVVGPSLVQYWRPDARVAGAVANGVRLILSPANRTYLDMKYDAQTALGQDWAGHVGVREAYEWDPATLLPGVPESAIVGVEAPLWSETAGNIRDVEFLAFPRLAEVAEIGWSRRDERHWEEFAIRLGRQAPRWTALGVNFHRAPQIRWVS
jgi:hexosaminidase